MITLILHHGATVMKQHHIQIIFTILTYVLVDEWRIYVGPTITYLVKKLATSKINFSYWEFLSLCLYIASLWITMLVRDVIMYQIQLRVNLHILCTQLTILDVFYRWNYKPIETIRRIIYHSYFAPPTRRGYPPPFLST